MECHWPYFVDPVTKHCVSYGIFEVAQDKIVVDESQLYFDVRISRNYYGELHKYTASLDQQVVNASLFGHESIATN